jgi:hypothetical protein
MPINGVNPQAVVQSDCGYQDIHPWNRESLIPQTPGQRDPSLPISFLTTPVRDNGKIDSQLSPFFLSGPSQYLKPHRGAPLGFIFL